MAKSKIYVEVTTKASPSKLKERIALSPWPVKLDFNDNCFPFPAGVKIVTPEADRLDCEMAFNTLSSFVETLHGISIGNSPDNWTIIFKKSARVAGLEGYKLTITAKGAEILARNSAGAFYGAQTLIQILACSFHVRLMLRGAKAAEPDAIRKRWIPELVIEDAPAYQWRSFMVDMGRANFSMPLLKRIVRIMGHLKLNLLHLHLFDDQLCGLRFDKLPLGSENSAAISIAELADLVTYARKYHVTVMPELESWGHVQSVLYHYPELYGGPGMWGGMSFGIGEKTYNLLARMYDEVIAVLEPECMLHVGLDEAVWSVLPGEEQCGHSPVNMVGRIYDLVQEAGRKNRRKVRMHLWADHGGRPVPENIADKVVIQPWKYRQSDEEAIIKAVQKYGGKGKTPCMMGAGWSSVHYNGSYEATRIWARAGRNYSNIIGITNCMWETNDLAGQMLGLYGGAAYSWNSDKPVNSARDPIFEDVRCRMQGHMQHWQTYFPDADPTSLNSDRGPHIMQGRYISSIMPGMPVAPTVEWEIGTIKA